MPHVRVALDRGTLRVHGEVGALVDLLGFDERTGFHRASAHRHAALLALAHERGVDVEDSITLGWQRRRGPGVPPSLRPHQQALAAFAAFGRRGVVALPTGSGKTRIACAAMAESGDSTVVLVPTRVLIEQWVSMLRSLFGAPIGAVTCGSTRSMRLWRTANC